MYTSQFESVWDFDPNLEMILVVYRKDENVYASRAQCDAKTPRIHAVAPNCLRVAS